MIRCEYCSAALTKTRLENHLRRCEAYLRGDQSKKTKPLGKRPRGWSYAKDVAVSVGAGSSRPQTSGPAKRLRFSPITDIAIAETRAIHKEVAPLSCVWCGQEYPAGLEETHRVECTSRPAKRTRRANGSASASEGSPPSSSMMRVEAQRPAFRDIEDEPIRPSVCNASESLSEAVKCCLCKQSMTFTAFNRHIGKCRTSNQPRSTASIQQAKSREKAISDPIQAIDLRDAKRHWGSTFRDRNGEFGSYPVHDDHGDESGSS